MEEYLSQRYSNLLDVEDVEDLFDSMKQVYGSIQKTCDRCNIARTTVYGWKNANYVKTTTKTKVLKASIETNLIATLRVLTNKSKERSSDLLITYFSSIYQKAISVDQSNFRQFLNQFLTERREHYGLINDTIQNEVDTMLQSLAEKSIEFHIPFPSDTIDMIRPTQMLEILPNIVTELFIKRADPSEIMNKYNVPIEIPNVIRDAYNFVMPNPTRRDVQPSDEQWHQVRKLKTPSDFPEIGKFAANAYIYRV